MVRFLETVLEAKKAFRPPFEFPGTGSMSKISRRSTISIAAPHENLPRGIIGHVAFGVYDYVATKTRIESTAILGASPAFRTPISASSSSMARGPAARGAVPAIAAVTYQYITDSASGSGA